jgi:hypothetical protein
MKRDRRVWSIFETQSKPWISAGYKLVCSLHAPGRVHTYSANKSQVLSTVKGHDTNIVAVRKLQQSQPTGRRA